ncbi:hypothetical protein [Spiroplasma endosymbiont of Cantharis nigra]|uniref:hypothetical protein n=1 Tax=Spiroplasma endosymbiont of Cantharis nigra TaxID=3066278 RepID=UPI0030CB15AA
MIFALFVKNVNGISNFGFTIVCNILILYIVMLVIEDKNNHWKDFIGIKYPNKFNTIAALLFVIKFISIKQSPSNKNTIIIIKFIDWIIIKFLNSIDIK